jgi:hypothetical protein
MPCSEMTALYSENRKKQANNYKAQIVNSFSIKAGGTHSYHRVLKQGCPTHCTRPACAVSEIILPSLKIYVTVFLIFSLRMQLACIYFQAKMFTVTLK